jgi:diguanylate cyclase (GGDEF)-like protein
MRSRSGRWLCNEEEAEWISEMARRLGSSQRIAGTVNLIAVSLCAPRIGLLALVLYVLAGGLSGVAVARTVRIGRPELLIPTAVLAAVLTGASVLLARDHDPILVILLVFPAVLASIGLPGRVAHLVLFVICGFLVAAWTLEPASDYINLVLPLAMTVTASLAAGAARRSSFENRGAATVDALTGMPNRASLMARVDELSELARLHRESIGVIVLDLDHFKWINDHHGHAIGDAVLAEVGAQLRGTLRAYDHAYRLGGEEFVILVPGGTLEETTELGDRLLDCVRAIRIGELTVTASAGIAVSHGARFVWRDVFAAADAALYRAKRAGRDRAACSRGARGEHIAVVSSSEVA